MNSLSKRRSNNLARSKARRKRLDRIRKRLAVGTLREVRLFAEVRSVIPNLGRAYTLNTGKTQTILYQDQGGKKMHIRKVEQGKERELNETLEVMLERKVADFDIDSPVEITVSIDENSDLEIIHQQIREAAGEQTRIRFVGEQLQGGRVIDIKNFLQQASDNRSPKGDYRQILRLMDEAQQLENNQPWNVADVLRWNEIIRDIKALEKGARSKDFFKKKKRNEALKKALFLLGLKQVALRDEDTGEYGLAPTLDAYGPLPQLDTPRARPVAPPDPGDDRTDLAPVEVPSPPEVHRAEGEAE